MQQLPSNISDLPSYLLYLLLNPTFNLTAAFILYATLVVLLLLIMVVGILVLTRRRLVVADAEPEPKEDEELERLAPGETFEGYEDEPATDRKRPHARKATRRRLSREARLVLGSAGALLFVVAWLTAGYTTSQASLCKDCHWPAAQHASAARGSDEHADVACVSCHESGGPVGRYVTGVPDRLLHLIDANSEKPSYEYGAVTVSACSRCHEGEIEGVIANEARGLKMSHREPLDASATCIDCHALRAGVVGTHNAGMTACLRCHDSVAQSADCTVCHETQAASAARARTTVFTDVQIPDVSCGGCHDEKQQCDPCHGLRMPHSTEFKLYAHSRAGVVDFWYNGGKTCSKCHNASRRSCQECHSSMLGHAHSQGAGWIASGHKAGKSISCDSCHRQSAYIATRDFCKDICHTPAAEAESPR